MPGIQLSDPYASAFMRDQEERWLRDLTRKSLGISVGQRPGAGPGEPVPEPKTTPPAEEKPFWRRMVDFFGQGAQSQLEGYNDALSDNTRGAVLPIRRDPQTGDYSLAWPRLLDVINTLPSPATAGGVTLGAGGAMRAALRQQMQASTSRPRRAWRGRGRWGSIRAGHGIEALTCPSRRIERARRMTAQLIGLQARTWPVNMRQAAPSRWIALAI